MKKPVVIFLSLFLFVVLLIFLVFFITIIGKSDRIETDLENEGHLFKVTQVDSSSHKTHIGIISTSEEYFSKNEDFISYEDPSTGIHSMISRLGSNDFFCTGSCFCKEFDQAERRSSATSGARGLIEGILVLVSAATTFLAYQKAEEYFETECREGLIDTCSSPLNIQAEIDECKPVDDGLEREDSDTLTSDPDEENVEFVCHGRCIQDPNVLKVLGGDSLDCDEFGRVVGVKDEVFDEAREEAISVFNVRMKHFCSQREVNEIISVPRTGTIESQERVALESFYYLHLEKFCKSIRMSAETLAHNLVFQDEKATRYLTNSLYQGLGSSGEAGVCSSAVTGEIVPDRSAVEEYSKEFPTLQGWAEHVQGLEPPKTRNLRPIVCLRQFNEREWEDKVPYEDENLRHWKEGKKDEVEYFTEERVMTETKFNLYKETIEAIKRTAEEERIRMMEKNQ